MVTTRRKRNETKPLPDRTPVLIKSPNDSDLRIFQALHPHFGFRFLPTHWLHRVAKGGYYNDFIKRCGHLKEEQNNFLYWPPQQEYSKNSNYQHGVFGLAPRGATAINTEVLPLNKQDYPHELLRSMVEASFFFGAEEAGLRHLGWRELSAHPLVPIATRSSRYPFSIKLSTGWLKPDGAPIMLIREDAKQQRLPIAAKEIDRNTENDETIIKKFRNYDEFIKSKIYQSHYGFDKALIAWITASEERMHKLMALSEKAVGKTTYHIFQHLAKKYEVRRADGTTTTYEVGDYATDPHFPPPHGDMVMKPWKRVGHPDFSIKDMKAVS